MCPWSWASGAGRALWIIPQVKDSHFDLRASLLKCPLPTSALMRPGQCLSKWPTARKWPSQPGSGGASAWPLAAYTWDGPFPSQGWQMLAPDLATAHVLSAQMLAPECHSRVGLRTYISWEDWPPATSSLSLAQFLSGALQLVLSAPVHVSGTRWPPEYQELIMKIEVNQKNFQSPPKDLGREGPFLIKCSFQIAFKRLTNKMGQKLSDSGLGYIWSHIYLHVVSVKYGSVFLWC